eukprot:1148571-Pelagomonas_calceolata.AAC.5
MSRKQYQAEGKRGRTNFTTNRLPPHALEICAQAWLTLLQRPRQQCFELHLCHVRGLRCHPSEQDGWLKGLRRGEGPKQGSLTLHPASSTKTSFAAC